MRCVCHVHIVGAVERHPQAATRTYLAQPATLDELRARAASRAISHFVIVQPSFYGTDNSLLLASLDTLGDRGRGVAVIDAATPHSTLVEFAARRIRGLRLNLYSPSGAAAAGQLDSALTATEMIARTMAWHVEVIAPIGLLVESADRLARAGVPLVIDHYGLYGRAAPESPEGRRLLALLVLPHVWVKLSAPYRVSDDPLCTRPHRAWLAAILAAARDRCVWGSDWPHTPPHEQHRGSAIPAPHRDLCYETLVDEFVGALGSAALAERIMWRNPARLYGFSAIS